MKKIICSLAVSILYSLLTAFCALLLTGFGHGWTSVNSSISIIFIAIVVGSVWSIKKNSSKTILLWCLVAFFCIDLAIIVNTAFEGFHYMANAISKIPFVFTSWALLWLGAHVVIVSRIRSHVPHLAGSIAS